MTVGQAPVETVLGAVRRHLETRHVCTLATAQGDLPWAASCFYALRDFDLCVCQRRDARTLANMLANPIQTEELTFVDRANKIRTRLIRRDGQWRFADEE